MAAVLTCTLQVFLTAQCTVNLFAVDYGYGRTQACLLPENLYRALQVSS